jgi:serine/threonine-protein kinase
VTAEPQREQNVEMLGQFRVVRRLASGSGRDVFLAEDAEARRVVLKVLGAPQLDEGLLDPRITEEARAYARLSHPNLVKVVDLFSVDGSLVIALEYVEGSTLNVVRAALGRMQLALDDGCWIYVASSIFAGLAAAHAARDSSGNPAPILHRNINPANVYVAWDGTIKLGDFGVAAVADAMHNSNPGLTWGSYGYFAPEQARPMPIGPHTDVYSVMLVLWELLAGRKAVERGALSEVELLDLMASPNIPPLAQIRPDIDLRVSELVRAGLQRDPTKRTVDAAGACKILRTVGNVGTAHERFASALARILSEGTRSSGEHAVSSHIWSGEHAVSSHTSSGEHTVSSHTSSGEHSAPSRPSSDEHSLSSTPSPLAPLVPPAPPSQPSPRQPPPLPARALQSQRARDAQRDSTSVHPTTHSPVAPAPDPATPKVRGAVAFAGAVSCACALLVAVLLGPPAPETAARRAPRAEESLAPVPSSAPIPSTALLSSVAPDPSIAPVPSTAPVASTAPLPSSEPPPPSATATPEAPADTPAEAPANAAAAASAAASAAAPDPDVAADIPADQGELRPPPYAAGHRIYVDGRVVGEGTDPIRVKCGSRSVRVGSAGRLQQIDVPCGEAIDLAR